MVNVTTCISLNVTMIQRRKYATLACTAMFPSTFTRASDKQSTKPSVFTLLSKAKTLNLAILKFNKAESQILSLGILDL